MFQEMQCANVVIIIAIFMITECTLMAITALLQVALFPVFGLVSVPVIVGCYMRVGY